MADSENKNLETTNSTIQTNQVENQTIPTQSNNEPNPMNEGQGNQDFSKLFSENITIDSSDPTNIQSQNTQHAELNNAVADTTNMNNNTPENKNLETSSQTTLGDNKEQTTNAANAAQTTQPTQENSLEKAQKEKLIQLIKVHELKAQKKGLTKGILYGVVLTIGIVALSIIFAKDQVVNLLNNQPENNLPLNANIVDLNNQNVEDNNENETDLLTGDILLTGDDQDLTGNDILPEEQDNTKTSDTIENDNTTQENETIEDTNEGTTALEDITLENEDNTLENSDEEINENEDNNDENTDNNDENNTELTGDIQGTEELEQTNDEKETSTNNDEESTIEESNPTTGNNYIITRVSSTGEANWVLPAFCGDDIFCNNLHQTFTPCIEFKRNEKLNDNANRIGNNGVCRFKDFSELVYVTFN